MTIEATTIDAFGQWLQVAQPGDRCIYYRGLGLAGDARARPAIEALRATVQAAAGLNPRLLTEQQPGKALIRGLNGYFVEGAPRLVDLVQRRAEMGRYIEYLAIMRRNQAPIRRTENV